MKNQIFHYLQQLYEDKTVTIGFVGDQQTPWAELLDEAAGAADWLQDQGVTQGEIVPVIRPFGPSLVRDFLALIFVGALPCVMAPPNPKMPPDVFDRKLHGMLATKELRHTVGEHVIHGLCRLEPKSTKGRAKRYLNRQPDPKEPLFLQHSSGTSGIPKAVVISHEKLLSQLMEYGASLEVNADDAIVSWLPLYHDMGMCACLWGSIVWKLSLSLMNNFRWVLDPLMLMEEIERQKSTLVWLPNFAFSFLAKANQAKGTAYDLSSIRRWINCSEPITQSSFELFLKAFPTTSPSTLSACYAMAETVFAVSQTAGVPKVIKIDRLLYETSRKVVESTDPSSLCCVSSGVVLPSLEVQIVDGEIWIRGGYVLQHYHGNSEAALIDGWYRTGDLGFLHEGELYVVGRLKDIVIVGGRNIDPTEIEALAYGVKGVIPGRACCVGVDDTELGTQSLTLIVETELSDEADLIRDLKMRIKECADAPLRHVHLVPPRWLVKSSSGKIARHENRERLLKTRP